MPSVAETRLAAYLAAEAAILQAQEARSGDRTHRMAELTAVQRQITLLQAEVAREKARAANGSSLGYSLANISGIGR